MKSKIKCLQTEGLENHKFQLWQERNATMPCFLSSNWTQTNPFCSSKKNQHTWRQPQMFPQSTPEPYFGWGTDTEALSHALHKN